MKNLKEKILERIAENEENSRKEMEAAREESDVDYAHEHKMSAIGYDRVVRELQNLLKDIE